jgi:predicted glutamine amidotransferase
MGSFVLAVIFLLAFHGTGSACRLYGVIGNNLPDNLLYTHLISAPSNSLETLSYSQIDGWGIGYYPEFGDDPIIERSRIRAYNDPLYDAVVDDINFVKPQITIAHIRTCSSGCCSHGTDTIPDPHPFYREKNGKTWIFIHNGGASKTILTTLLGDYLIANPPNGSGIANCDPSNPNMVVDSELYFLFVLKKIEENGWNAVNGITEAISAMIEAGANTSAINFLMSDGDTLWAFRKGGSGYTLYYLNGTADPVNGYVAVASQTPSAPAPAGNWVMITDHQLVIMTRSAAPVVITDVRTYCPGDINHDEQSDTADLEEFAEYFAQSGGGDLDFDGDVDGTDLATLARVYGRACP